MEDEMSVASHTAVRSVYVNHPRLLAWSKAILHTQQPHTVIARVHNIREATTYSIVPEIAVM